MKTTDIGGAALAVGALLVMLLLYRDPASGVEAATSGLPAMLYFVVLPALGLVAGVYTYVGGPYNTVALFILGSYLGVVSLALILGSVKATDPVGLPLAVGLLVLPLSLAALMSSVLRSIPFAQLNTIGSSEG